MWAHAPQGSRRSPSSFSLNEVHDLFHQLVTARNGRLTDPIVDWSFSLYSDTEGSKGLTGLCMLEVCLAVGVRQLRHLSKAADVPWQS